MCAINLVAAAVVVHDVMRGCVLNLNGNSSKVQYSGNNQVVGPEKWQVARCELNKRLLLLSTILLQQQVAHAAVNSCPESLIAPSTTQRLGARTCLQLCVGCSFEYFSCLCGCIYFLGESDGSLSKLLVSVYVTGSFVFTCG